ncbi:MAG: nitrous oxide reductase family maturation protein NosD [Methylococcales bacterium]|jgi:nitrous oxidase accessory protein|nr:nitrous oxide reductase family maturation protein NosD [Methylococcales bacterium]MBT7409423.1 nitrous oxide reductase family maturation protein NosD [Methylococcales bacterium]
MFTYLFLFLLFPFSLLADDLIVPSEKFGTIQSALNFSATGDKILLRPGTYQENISIKTAIHLTSADPTNPAIIDGSLRGRTIDVFSPKVSLSHLKIINSGDDIGETDACIYIQKKARGINLQYNHLSQCAFGIWVNGTTDVIIKHNFISGIQRKYYSDRGNGINLWAVKNGQIEYNTITEVRDGIYLTVTKKMLVKNNMMYKVRFGIHYMYNDDNTLIKNTVCHSMVGLAMMFSKRLVIKGNRAINNAQHGILFRSIYDSKISQNYVHGNNKGLFLNDASFNTITSNLVEENKIGTHVTAGSEENAVTKNNFVANPIQVKYTWRRSQHWDSKKVGNYWSDYLGWDFDNNKVGDKIYYASNRMDHLIFKYPQIKLLAQSPAVQLLQSLESRFPVLRPPSIIDRTPAIAPFKLEAKLFSGKQQKFIQHHCKS